MRIGFLSGDVVELTPTRKSVSVPDYPVQGLLLKKLQERGHEIVVLTDIPQGTPFGDLPDFDLTAPEEQEDPNQFNLDVLLTDRIGRDGGRWRNALMVLERYVGPIVFHQYIGYPGWAPPFREMPHLLDIRREWTVVNRANDPYAGYHSMVGYQERLRRMSAKWERWEPFLMAEHPWNGQMGSLPRSRRYLQGYYGRVPRKEKRAQLVLRYLSNMPWDRIVYGPPTSTKWLHEMTGAVDGGRIQHADLPAALADFSFIVQVPHDRFAGNGALDIWPNRIGECALAGVLQFFDRGYGLTALRDWQVDNATHLRQFFRALSDPDWREEQVRLQRQIILPRCDAEKNIDQLEQILYRATGLAREKAA